MSDKITTDRHGLEPGTIIDLFELDITKLPGASEEPMLRWHSGFGEGEKTIVWGGNVYSPFPIEAEGFEKSGKGAIPRPTLTVANLTNLLTSSLKDYNDLLGAKVTRKRTFAKYLDSFCYIHGYSLGGTCSIAASIDDDVTSKGDCKGTWTPYTELACTDTAEEGGVCKFNESLGDQAGTFASVYPESIGGVDYWVFFTAIGGTGRQDEDVLTIQGFTEEEGYSAFNGTWSNISVSSSRLQIPFSALPSMPQETNSLPTYITNTASWVPKNEPGCYNISALWIPDTGGIWYENVFADDMAHFPEEIWYIDRKAVETHTYLQFELTAAHDIIGVKLPARSVISNLCPWIYRDAGTCGYDGSNGLYDSSDEGVAFISDDVCGKTFKSCEKRFPEGVTSPFGGFPGASKNLG